MDFSQTIGWRSNAFNRKISGCRVPATCSLPLLDLRDPLRNGCCILDWVSYRICQIIQLPIKIRCCQQFCPYFARCKIKVQISLGNSELMTTNEKHLYQPFPPFHNSVHMNHNKLRSLNLTLTLTNRTTKGCLRNPCTFHFVDTIRIKKE